MRPKIYLFGDSITEFSFDEGGWGASLANHFARTVLFPFLAFNIYIYIFLFFVVDDGDFETYLAYIYIYVLTWTGWCGAKRVRWVQHEMGTAGFGEGISSGGRWRRTLSCDCVLWCKRCLPSWQIRCLPTRAPAWIQAQPPLHCLVSQGEIYLFLQEQQFFFLN